MISASAIRKKYCYVFFLVTCVSDLIANSYIDTTGIETVRRDNCALVRTVMTEVLDRLLMKKDVEGAIAYVKKRVSDLLMNKVRLIC